jgi:hypothetical protein
MTRARFFIPDETRHDDSQARARNSLESTGSVTYRSSAFFVRLIEALAEVIERCAVSEPAIHTWHKRIGEMASSEAKRRMELE